MAESDWNFDGLADSVKELRWWFRNRPDVYVAGNMLIYYVEGNPKKSLAPDVFVVFGVPNHKRRTYKIWEEGQVPRVVIEITSPSTRDEDLVVKKPKYQSWGVAEYYMFDPLDEYLQPRLQGFSLVDGIYHPMSSLVSPALGMELFGDGDRLRFRDTASGVVLPTYEEIMELNEEAARRVREAERQVREAEAHSSMLEEEMRRLQQRLSELEGGGP